MPDLGSGICIISVIRNYAEKLELHGWDHYLTSDPGDKGYVGRLLDLLFGSLSYKLLPISNIFRAIYNFHYGYYFSQMPNINNHGFTATLASPNTKFGQKLAKRFDNFFYTSF